MGGGGGGDGGMGGWGGGCSCTYISDDLVARRDGREGQEMGGGV